MKSKGCLHHGLRTFVRFSPESLNADRKNPEKQGEWAFLYGKTVSFKNFVITIQTPEGRQEQQVASNPMTIGRSYSVDLPLILTEVSRSHLKVYCENRQLFIEDLGSKNGTFVKGKRIQPHQPVPYAPGESISLGKGKESISIVAEFLAQSSTPPPLDSESTKEERALPPPLEQSERLSESSFSQLMEMENPFRSSGKPKRPEEFEPFYEQKFQLEAEIRELQSQLQEVAEQSKGLEFEVEALLAQKKELSVENADRKLKLQELKKQISGLEEEWRSKADVLLKEQAKIKAELQQELQQMKTLFDSRRQELEQVEHQLRDSKDQNLAMKKRETDLRRSIEELEGRRSLLENQVFQLEGKHAQLNSEVGRKEEIMAEIQVEAENFFVERQNELLEERQSLESLSEKRMLEVEMEMADLKAKRVREMEDLLKDQEGKFKQQQEALTEELIVRMVSALNHQIRSKLEAGEAERALKELRSEVPHLVRCTLTGETYEAPAPAKKTEFVNPWRIWKSVQAHPRRWSSAVAGFVLILLVVGLRPELQELDFASLTAPGPASYTERFSDDTYFAFENDEKNKKAWKAELNRLLVSELGFETRQADQYWQEERKLLQTLHGIHKRGTEDHVEQMRQAEERFQTQVAKIFDDATVYSRIQQTKSRFSNSQNR